jgi:DNA-binding transcriptional LysR family regulator
MTWQPTVQVLELAVNPTFSTHWLIPNLREFNKLHPGIIVNIHSLANIGDFLSREYDAAIMREDFCSPWAEVEYLFEEEILPVCGCGLLSNPGRSWRSRSCWASFRCCIKAREFTAGRSGLRCRISPARRSTSVRVLTCSMLIAAVRSNLGVALLPRFAIQHDLDSGEMVIPCDVPIRTGNRFIMTWQEDKAESRIYRYSASGCCKNRWCRLPDGVSQNAVNP